MVYNMHNCGSYNIHTIKTNRFKNIRMEIIFRNNIDVENVHLRTLLFELLLENSKDYKTKRDITLFQEYLYRALSYSVSSKLGNMMVSSIVMDFLNPKYTNENYLEEALKFPFDLIFNPNITDNEFDEKTLNVIKNRIITDIKSSKENKLKYALKEALKKSFKSVTSVDINGDIESVEAITSESLIKVYNDMLKHDYIDIFIIGDIDENKCIDIISKYARFNTIKTHDLSIYVDNKARSKVLKTKDTIEGEQSQLVMIYNTLSLTERERKYIFLIYNLILGGSSLDTRLYKKLRDEYSLCYAVNSIYQKYDNLLIITTSIDKSNINLATKLIREVVESSKKDIKVDDVNKAISMVITSLNTLNDYPDKIIDAYLFNYMKEADTIDERLHEFKNVTLEEVINVSKKVKLNSIYILEGEENGKD